MLQLDLTIEIILRRIYEEQSIYTINRDVMKELLLLSTKHAHFTFNGEFY